MYLDHSQNQIPIILSVPQCGKHLIQNMSKLHIDKLALSAIPNWSLFSETANEGIVSYIQFLCGLTLLPWQWCTGSHTAGWRGRWSLLLPWWQRSRRGRRWLVAGGRRWRRHHAHWRWQQTYKETKNHAFSSTAEFSLLSLVLDTGTCLSHCRSKFGYHL